MRTLLLFSILVWVMRAKGQNTDHPLDTVLVWRIVADTGIYPKGPLGLKYTKPITLKQIREVRELHNTYEGRDPDSYCYNCTYVDFHKHIKYLTRFGHPLPAGWIVIETETLADALPVSPPAPLDTSDHGVTIYGSGLTGTLDSSVVHILQSGASYFSGTNGGASIGQWKAFVAPEMQAACINPEWLTRRLRRRFEKFYHLGKYSPTIKKKR